MYIDHAATTTIRPEAVAAIRRAWDDANGNASGTHAVARSAKNALEAAREEAAELIGADRPDEVVFTSGGTESDNLAVVGAALAHQYRGIVVSAIEHKAVLEAAAALDRFGYAITHAECDDTAVVNPELVDARIGLDTAVVSVMAANNEVGTVQPIADIAGRVRATGSDAVLHTDAVQSFIARDVRSLIAHVDLLTLAAHKFGGPKGVGLLYVRSGTAIDPILHGGGQEAGRRSGTANVAGVVGMVAAMRAADADRERFVSDIGSERTTFESELERRLGVVVTAKSTERLPQFSHVRFPGIEAENLLIRLDQAGIHAAAGSSCQSGAIEPSHVLLAAGMTPVEAGECVRFSFGWDAKPGDGMRAATAVADVVEVMR